MFTVTDAKEVCTRIEKAEYFPSLSISVVDVGIDTEINFFKLYEKIRLVFLLESFTKSLE